MTVQSRTASVVHDHLDVCLGEKLQYFLRGHELLKRINVEPGGAQQMSNVSYCPEHTGGLFLAARWDEAGTTLPLTLMLQLTAVAAGPVEPRQHRGHNIGAPIPILYLSLVGTCSGAVDPGSDDPDGYRAEKHRHQCLINGFTSVWLWILTVRGWPWVMGRGSWVVGHQYESNYRENIQILSLSTNTKS